MMSTRTSIIVSPAGFNSQIKRALKPGGVVLFETITVDYLKHPAGKSFRKEYLLKRMFEEIGIVHYAELADSDKAIAQLVTRTTAGTSL